MSRSNQQTRNHLSPMPIIIGFVLLEIVIISLGYGQWATARNHALARRYAKEKRYDESIRNYQKLLQKFPDSPTINYELGLVLLDTGQYEESIQPLQIAALSDPPPQGILTELGLAYMGAKQPKDALDFFKEALRENSHDPVAAFFIGEQMYRSGQYVPAASFLEKAAFHPTYGKKAQEYLKQIEQKVLAK